MNGGSAWPDLKEVQELQSQAPLASNGKPISVMLFCANHLRGGPMKQSRAFFNIDEIDKRLPPEEVAEMRRASAEYIPSVLPALRKMAQILASKAASPMRSSIKIGRNELCPCGSGKKYKRCCGLN